MVGEDTTLRQALDLARVVAPIRNPVLIVGPAGSGKSLLARIIHELGPRRNGPFVEACCRPAGSLPVDAVLFGSPGAQTDAERQGKLQLAHGGTLVLDEVGGLDPAQQLKVHMTLKDGRLDPVGPPRVGRLDVRLILTARSDWVAEAPPGQFWNFIYTQNSCTTLRLPPLVERGSDIVLLAEQFLGRAARELGRNLPGFAPDALKALCQYAWPGNITELKSTIRKALAQCKGPKIEPVHLGLSAGPIPPELGTRRLRVRAGPPGVRRRVQPLREALAEPEKWLILQALQARDWSRQEAADALLINRATLEKKMKKYGLFAGERHTSAAPVSSS
jgi:DNA-binding NtrC family response regulator